MLEGRRSRTALIRAGVVALALCGPLCAAPGVGAAGIQDPAPEPVPGPEATDAVPPSVPEDGSATSQAPAPSSESDASTTTVAVVAPAAGSQEKSESDKANERVRMIVVALLVLAVVVAAVTVAFWRRTNPRRVAASEAKMVASRAGEP